METQAFFGHVPTPHFVTHWKSALFQNGAWPRPDIDLWRTPSGMPPEVLIPHPGRLSSDTHSQDGHPCLQRECPTLQKRSAENGTSWQARFCTNIYLSATYSIEPLPSLMKKHGTWQGTIADNIALYNWFTRNYTKIAMDISMPTCSEKRNGAGDRGKGEMETRVNTWNGTACKDRSTITRESGRRNSRHIGRTVAS